MTVWYLDLQLPVYSVSFTTKVVSSSPAHGEVYSIQQYVIKFVCDSGILFNNTDRYDMIEILLKVALNTTHPPIKYNCC